MTFLEWAEQYGIESARRQFRMSDHMVFTVRVGKYVEAQCGNWRGSQPLSGGACTLVAMQRLRNAVCNCFATEEIIYA